MLSLFDCVIFLFAICRIVHNHINHYRKHKMSKEEDLINAVIARAQESEPKKKLACAQAFELAEEFDAAIIEIGRICNRHNIRICKCQLGCFK